MPLGTLSGERKMTADRTIVSNSHFYVLILQQNNPF